MNLRFNCSHRVFPPFWHMRRPWLLPSAPEHCRWYHETSSRYSEHILSFPWPLKSITSITSKDALKGCWLLIGSPPNNKVERMCLLSNIDKYLSCHEMMSFQFVFNKLKNNTYTQIYFADRRAQTFNRRLIFHFRFFITNRRTFFCLKVVSCTSI